MLLNIIVHVFLILTFLYTLFKGEKKAILNIYLPFLIFIPGEIYITIEHYPDFSPAQGIMLGIILAYICRMRFKWKSSIADFLVLGYIAACIFSETMTKGESNLVNVIRDAVLNVFFPYFFIKNLISLEGLQVAFSQRLVFLVFLVALTAPYEVRMTDNIFVDFFSIFFDFGERALLFRDGRLRFSGPFTHAILAGTIMAMMLFLHYWLFRNRLWGRTARFYPYIMAGILFLALILTSSRAPLFAFLGGCLVVGIGFSKKRRESLIKRFILGIIFCIAVYFIIEPYMTANPDIVGQESEATLSYRLNLISSYADTVAAKPWFGWGYFGWPKLLNRTSIDNHYLWLTLRHGLVSLFFFLSIYVAVMLRLLYKGLNFYSHQIIAASLAFTLLTIFLVQFIVYYTVYMTEQADVLFFAFTGLAEGFLILMAKNRDDLPVKTIQQFKHPSLTQRTP